MGWCPSALCLDQVLDCGGDCLVGNCTVGRDSNLAHTLGAGAARKRSGCGGRDGRHDRIGQHDFIGGSAGESPRIRDRHCAFCSCAGTGGCDGCGFKDRVGGSDIEDNRLH